MLATAPVPPAAALPIEAAPVEVGQEAQAAPLQATPPQAPGAPVPEPAVQDTLVEATRSPDETAPVQDDVVVLGRSKAGDPLADLNAGSFGATQAVDDAVVGPVAKAYKKVVPSPFRKGLRNFLANLREPVVALNYLLQLKAGKAGETVGRFAINTTVGIAGVIDVAKKKPFRLPRRRNGFANTLGYYGVKPGPFFFLPLIGPTTLRDLIGNSIDQFVPIGPVRPFSGQSYTIPVAVLSALDYRVEFDDELEAIRAKQDPYAAARRFYLERRQAEIDALKGKPIAPDAPRPIIPAVLDTDPVPE